MIERYSHIRMAAKREAVEALTTWPKNTIPDGVGTKVGTIGKSAILQ